MPGWRSTKKLPSRKIRGRIAKVASWCSGRPWLEIVIVTSAAWQSLRFCPSTVQPGPCETSVTVPTLIPAIRTSDPGRRPFALENVAWTVNWLANGFANFVYAR